MGVRLQSVVEEEGSGKSLPTRNSGVVLTVEMDDRPAPPTEDFHLMQRSVRAVIDRREWQRSGRLNWRSGTRLAATLLSSTLPQEAQDNTGGGRRDSMTQQIWARFSNRRTSASEDMPEGQASPVAMPDLEPLEDMPESGFIADAHRSNRVRKYYRQFGAAVCLLYCIVTWYAGAIFFPPSLQEGNDRLFWTPGGLIYGANNTATVCPKATLCSEGWGQILLLILSRLTAFVMYVTIGLVYLTKCHALVHFLAKTYIAEIFPLEYLHTTHKTQGAMFLVLGVLHTIGHLIRWGMRSELSVMGGLSVFITGLLALILLLVIILPMSLPALKEKIPFEKRFALHAGRFVEVLLLICLLLHATRAGVIALIFTGCWAADASYMLLFRTFRLETVELTALDDHANAPSDAPARNSSAGNTVGVQMLWQNPSGFKPTSGEFVKVQFPWLSVGGEEWHPFSIYLREATAEGLSIAVPSEGGGALGGMGGGAVRTSNRRRSTWQIHKKFEEAAQSLMSDLDTSELADEARSLEDASSTTQVFIMPVGDWTRRVSEAVKDQALRRHRTCWIRGPYSSPFAIAHDFSQLILFASGIGITPALGVLGHYKGAKRIKFVVWMTRSASMLKFFAPLLADSHFVYIYFTGKPKLTSAELTEINAAVGGKKIFVHQQRPNLEDVFKRIIVAFEGVAAGRSLERVEDIDPALRDSWCGLYCGGSHNIQNMLAGAARKWGVGWQAELFDW